MIDIESKLYDPIAKALRAEFSGINVTGERLTSTPSKFPTVSLYEMDNTTPDEMIDSSGIEKFADVTYHLSVYSNKASGKKSQCKEILAFVDSILFSYGFTREGMTPELPLNNNSIYWISARYVARTDGQTIYRL